MNNIIVYKMNRQIHNCKLLRPNYWYSALGTEVNCYVIIKITMLIPGLVKPEYHKDLGPEVYDVQTPHGL